MLRFDSIPDAVRDLLTALCGSPVVHQFALGGGTSSALRFGHRLSVDLDFFSADRFHPEALLRRDGFPPHHTVLQRSAGSLAADCGGVKVEFLEHASPLLELVETVDGVPLLSLPDVAAMKLDAIANRGSKKDFFDLTRIFDEVSLEGCLGFFEQKYPNTDRFVAIRSLAWFQEAEHEPDPIAPEGPSWEEVKQRVSQALAGLS